MRRSTPVAVSGLKSLSRTRFPYTFFIHSSLPMNPFASYKNNVTSQFGEDGIVAELFKRIGTESKLCVEFGAWDGKHCSNTWTLWHDQGWGAVLIESRPGRVEQLKQDLGSAFPKVIPHVAFIKARGPQSLDALLPPLIGKQTIDLLSIDIDSDDGPIFEALETYLPRVAIVEYNPTIPPHLSLRQKEGEYFGTSARAMVEIAEKKGYTLVAMTVGNCFFVKNEEVPKLGLTTLPTLEELFIHDSLTYVISSFGGTLLTTRIPMFAKHSLLLPQLKQPQYTGNATLIPVVHFKVSSFTKLFWEKLVGKIKQVFKKA